MHPPSHFAPFRWLQLVPLFFFAPGRRLAHYFLFVLLLAYIDVRGSVVGVGLK
jgi:hypothetical protein